jgi:ribosomal protein S8E
LGCFCVGCTRKTRIIDVVYNASNNELVRTKTLVKNAIVTIDATPFRQWYEAHYALPLGRKKGAKLVSVYLSLMTVVGWGSLSFDCEPSDWFNKGLWRPPQPHGLIIAVVLESEGILGGVIVSKNVPTLTWI